MESSYQLFLSLKRAISSLMAFFALKKLQNDYQRY